MNYPWHFDEDDEPLEERPLTEWKKKELRREVELLRKQTDFLADQEKALRAERARLQDYVRANDRHHEMLRRMLDAFDRGGWRIAAMDMDVVQPEPEQFTTISSPIVSHVARDPYATMTVQMSPCPPRPEKA